MLGAAGSLSGEPTRKRSQDRGPADMRLPQRTWRAYSLSAPAVPGLDCPVTWTAGPRQNTLKWERTHPCLWAWAQLARPGLQPCERRDQVVRRHPYSVRRQLSVRGTRCEARPCLQPPAQSHHVMAEMGVEVSLRLGVRPESQAGTGLHRRDFI